ncbi:uncharacterized protein LOC123870976 [Maniola jurtina]|uniref:uncharacterized protein LOC123870976 n=1 Tax=Maniola jurtina TaxID=191418 RepID=UPI001E68656A|nr:uncharacterized protein LOC123870976 [Maniola jurtina]
MEKKFWSNQETKRFIALFKENPILWNKKSADYRNLAKKRKMENSFSVEFNTSVAEIGRKITILRTQWQKEYKKMKNPATHYESRWKWFQSLKPIFDTDQRIEDEDDDIDDSSTINGYLAESKEPDATYLYVDSEAGDLSFKDDEDCKNSNNDEYQIFGNYVAIKLRSMHHEKNIQELKKLIIQHIDLWTEKDDKEYYSTKIHLENSFDYKMLMLDEPEFEENVPVMFGLLGDDTYSRNDNTEGLEFGKLSKQIEFSSDSVSGLNECFTDQAQRLCIFDLAVKLTNNDHYDIGGTYKQKANIKSELWFYCTTSVCPQSNYILNIFACYRNEGTVSIGISDTSTIKKIRIYEDDDGLSTYCTLPETLCWKTYKSCERDESHHVKSFCFSKEDLKLLQKHTLCIPIKIKINTACVVDKETLQRIKRNHNLSKLFKRQEDTDFVLESTSGKKFEVHKILLGAHSLILRNILKDSSSDSLVLDINDDGMERLLEYIYTGSVKDISEHNWCQLIELANKFKLDNLFKETEYAISQQFSVTNAVDIAVMSEKYKLETIQQKVFEFIRSHPQVLETDGWKNLNDVALTKKLFKEIYYADST